MRVFDWGPLDGFFRDSFRPEVVSDVISGANIGLVAMDVRVQLGDSS